MQDALLVNPYSAEDIADAIATALSMPRDERMRRWKALMDNVRDRGRDVVAAHVRRCARDIGKRHSELSTSSAAACALGVAAQVILSSPPPGPP